MGSRPRRRQKIENLIEEFQRVKGANFELRFTCPTKQQLNKLRIVHRDVSPEERKRLQARQRSVAELIDEIESGRYHIEDLDEEVREKLENMFSKKGK